MKKTRSGKPFTQIFRRVGSSRAEWDRNQKVRAKNRKSVKGVVYGFYTRILRTRQIKKFDAENGSKVG